MKAFVTGSTGFLGSAVVRKLLADGYEVKGLARSAEKGSRFLGDTSAEIVLGDMLDIPALTPHMADCDLLFHVAAYFKEYTGADAGGEEKLQAINVDGTIALFEAAKSQGINNIIYVSSSGVIGKPANNQIADEQTDYNHETSNRYFQSKIRGEIAIDGWLQQHPEMRVILIRPAAIFGPGDNGPTGFGRMFIDVLNKQLPAIPAGGVTMVDVRDVAQAMVNAVESGESGDRFNIIGNYVTLAEIVPMIADAGGVKAPIIKLPYPMAWAFGAASELVAAITGKPPLATRVIIETMNERRLISAAKAKGMLALEFRPIHDSVRDAVTWFREFEYA